MTKKIYLGNIGKHLYMTETGTSYTDQKTYRPLTEFHGLDDKELLKKDLERTVNTILECVGRKTRPFELIIGNELQQAIGDIKKIFLSYFPNATVEKYQDQN